MIAAVFDTNVVISGLLSPDGSTGRVLDAMVEGLCQPVVTDRILAEYEEVLCHPKFRFPVPKIHLLLDAIRTNAIFALYVPVIHADDLPDPDDLIFLEAAISLQVPIVTGNSKHFPRKAVGPIHVCTPAEFLAQLSVK